MVALVLVAVWASPVRLVLAVARVWAVVPVSLVRLVLAVVLVLVAAWAPPATLVLAVAPVWAPVLVWVAARVWPGEPASEAAPI